MLYFTAAVACQESKDGHGTVFGCKDSLRQIM